MKIVSLIPARGGSKGVPNKALCLLNGKPLIEYTINASKKSVIIDETYVNTEDKHIKKFSLSKGIKVIDRPPKYATDTASIESVMMHFSEQHDFDIIVLIQSTSPLVTTQQIDDGLNRFIGNQHIYNSAMSVIDATDILFWDAYKCQAINYDPMNRGRRQNRINHTVIESGAFYITTKDQLQKSRCRVSKNIMFIEVPFWSSFQVDSMIDIKMIEKLMK